MRIGGYTDPCGVWWATPLVEKTNISFLRCSRQRLAINHRLNENLVEIIQSNISTEIKTDLPFHQADKSMGSADGVGKEEGPVILKRDERFSKYFKMLSVGLSKEAVQHRMQRDGLDPKY